jgi:hypothetical protein
MAHLWSPSSIMLWHSPDINTVLLMMIMLLLIPLL